MAEKKILNNKKMFRRHKKHIHQQYPYKKKQKIPREKSELIKENERKTHENSI